MYPHIHKYKLDSKTSNKHMHKIYGYTDCMIGIDSFHIHAFLGICSYAGHTHYYTGYTGLPVKTENGHIHKIEGRLETNVLHDHIFRSYTDEEVGYIPKSLASQAYV